MLNFALVNKTIFVANSVFLFPDEFAYYISSHELYSGLDPHISSLEPSLPNWSRVSLVEDVLWLSTPLLFF
ncbi:hypothetical protein GWK47_011523 [Chionoecetes opilio]|uniref:Uncharacterized protein n=1 Tax=Chionoecetes opilio TaxID=41210 RepID=A0A8J5CMG5_CHIOP|nr:hypothetical protein GWK47_011523 [Chionoecetes opilio]